MLEILTILDGQITVSLRNVELYNTIPSSHVIKGMKEKFFQFFANIGQWKWYTHLKVWGGTIAIVLALFLIKVPYNISANIEVQPITEAYYAKTQGEVQQVLVTEGEKVAIGDVLVILDIDNLMIELSQKEHSHIKVRTEMFKLKREGKIADYKIKENEYLSISKEMELLKKKITSSKIISKVDGVVISENLEELVGMPVNFGQELIKVASNQKLLIQFEVPEADVMYVNPGQDVKFKVFGHPTKSFSGTKLLSVGGEARQVSEADTNKYYLSKAMIELDSQSNEMLRPGMTGRGKIMSEWRSIGYRMFSGTYRFILMELF